MRKQDEDLKIDITEIFGGMVMPLEEKKEQETTTEAQTVSPESEQSYQAFIDERNKILEERTAEIETVIPPLEENHIAETPPVETETPPSTDDSVFPSIVTTEEVINFDAPMAPPFKSLDSGLTQGLETSKPLPDSIAEDAKALKEELEQAEAKRAAEVEAEAVRIESARIEAEKDTAARKIAIQKEHSLFLLFDEFRAIIDHELKDLVGERKSHNMLVKTFEISREKYPEIFRNANWDPSGTLLENGSLDGKRMAENAILLSESQREITVDMSLSYLMNLRFQAIEKGLGAGFKNKLRARLIQWVDSLEEGARKESKDPGPYNRLKSYLA